jgi:hypothetical protein
MKKSATCFAPTIASTEHNLISQPVPKTIQLKSQSFEKPFTYIKPKLNTHFDT